MRKVITNYDRCSVTLMDIDTKQLEHIEWETIIKRLQRSDKPRYLDNWNIIEGEFFPECICISTGKDIVYVSPDFSHINIIEPNRVSSGRYDKHRKVNKAPWILLKINIILAKIIKLLKRYT